MNKKPKYWNTAKKYLSNKDKVMSSLIRKYKSSSEAVLTSRKDIFFSLCKSIIGQQISVAAANSVILKFKKIYEIFNFGENYGIRYMDVFTHSTNC